VYVGTGFDVKRTRHIRLSRYFISGSRHCSQIRGCGSYLISNCTHLMKCNLSCLL